MSAKKIVAILLAIGMVVTLGSVGAIAWAGHRYSHHTCSEEDMKDHADFFVKRLARKIDATEEQKKAFTKELHAAIPQVMELKKEKKAIRKELVAALTADKVERKKLETLKGKALTLADKALTLAIGVTTSFSEIMTGEQRKKLSGKFLSHHGHHNRWGVHGGPNNGHHGHDDDHHDKKSKKGHDDH